MEASIKMDNNAKWVNEVKINRTLEALRKNNMEGFSGSVKLILKDKLEKAGAHFVSCDGYVK